MTRPIVKTSAEFKQTVIDMVKAMPLDDFLLMPQKEIDKYIAAWTDPDKETGISPAQLDYKQYFHFLMTLPEEMHIVDMDLYYFRIARKIVNNILLSMLETSYYQTVFGNHDVDHENYKLLYELISETADRIETNPDNKRAFMSAKELKDEFGYFYDKVVEEYNEHGG